MEASSRGTKTSRRSEGVSGLPLLGSAHDMMHPSTGVWLAAAWGATAAAAAAAAAVLGTVSPAEDSLLRLLAPFFTPTAGPSVYPPSPALQRALLAQLHGVLPEE